MATNNKNLSALINPLSKDNPVIVQILGICSCLAVTAKLEPACVMGISVIAVLAFANVIISFLRNTIPTNIRITNCILMGRLEAFAMGNKPWPSFLDGIGNGIGYAIILVIVAFFRELLGSGTLWGVQVVPSSWYEHGYVNNGLMILPPMALIVVACIIWIHRTYNKDLQEQ